MQAPISVELGTLPELFIFVARQEDDLRYFLVQGESKEDAKKVLEIYLADQKRKWVIGTGVKAKVVKRRGG